MNNTVKEIAELLLSFPEITLITHLAVRMLFFMR